MRRLLSLALALCLVVCLAAGSVSHAAELGDAGEAHATAGQHADGDHDPAPADGGKGVPHHHSICHGHDLTAAPRLCASAFAHRAALPRPSVEPASPGGTPAFPLRPPIA